ncbi:hypothetical protein [Kitasatospora sp. NPDC001527]
MFRTVIARAAAALAATVQPDATIQAVTAVQAQPAAEHRAEDMIRG